MQLSERTELLDRYFENGCKLFNFMFGSCEPSRENKEEMSKIAGNMELLENKIRTFDSLYYGHKKNLSQATNLPGAAVLEPVPSS